MINDPSQSMRTIYRLVEDYVRADSHTETAPVVLEENTIDQQVPEIVIQLEELSDKLRSIMEDSGGEYALGYEMGMQRAADMIDNLVNRHKGL